MKKRFLCGSAILIAFLLSSCTLRITSFDAPATTSIGEIITLTVNGEATKVGDSLSSKVGDSLGEIGIFLQIPDNWEVVAAIAKLDGDTSDYVLSHYNEDLSLYRVPSGYKIWAGKYPLHWGDVGGKITVTIKVRTGGIVNIGCSVGQSYFLKIAAVKRNYGMPWVVEDPSEMSDFSTITADKYVKTIVIKDDSCSSAANPALRLIFSCLKYQGRQYRMSLDWTPVSNDPSGLYWKYVVGSIAISDTPQSDCISLSDDFKLE